MRVIIYIAIATALLAAIIPANAHSGLRGKKLIEYGWDVPTPALMRDSLSNMEKRPFEGIQFRANASEEQ